MHEDMPYNNDYYPKDYYCLMMHLLMNSAGYEGAMAAVGLISVLLIMCIITLSLLLFKTKQELFEVKNRVTTTPIPRAQASNLSSTSTIIDTKKNIAYERVITQNIQTA